MLIAVLKGLFRSKINATVSLIPTLKHNCSCNHHRNVLSRGNRQGLRRSVEGCFVDALPPSPHPRIEISVLLPHLLVLENIWGTKMGHHGNHPAHQNSLIRSIYWPWSSLGLGTTVPAVCSKSARRCSRSLPNTRWLPHLSILVT